MVEKEFVSTKLKYKSETTNTPIKNLILFISQLVNNSIVQF